MTLLSPEPGAPVLAQERLPFPERAARRRDLTAAAAEFLADESAALDEREYDDWLAMLDPSFVYQVPVPLLREDPSLPRHSTHAMLFEATKHTLTLKLGRTHQQHAWSDRPGATTRHFVTGVRVFETDTGTDLRVDSNVLATWNRGPQESVMMPAARQDVLRPTGPGQFVLLRRRVLLDAEVPNHYQLSLIY